MEDCEEEIDSLDILSPEVCINETDPLITYTDVEGPETNHTEDVQEIIDVDDESKEASVTLVNGFNSNDNDSKFFKPGQIPDLYSEYEIAIYPTMFGGDHQCVELSRIHCTACNVHLGSAPYDQDDRYIHPLLKVIICKSCFDFYGSGEFDKDEDGSELYCRWCGQGGKVLCCAKCPFVFCQKCIRLNLGKKALDAVVISDDWLCFVCNSKQIIRQRITCRALYEYVEKELVTWRPLNRPDLLELDKSLCCKQRSSSNTPKRRSSQESFIDNEKKAKKKKVCVNPLSKANKSKKTFTKKSTSTSDNPENKVDIDAWENGPGDEVVCTPDLLMIMNFEEGSESTALHDGNDEPEVTATVPIIDSTTNGESSIKPKYKVQVAKKINLALKSKTVPIKKYPALKKILNRSNQKADLGILNSLPDLQSGLSHEWFDKTAQAAAKVIQNLSSKLCSLSSEQESIKTVHDLTKMHNEVQEILGNVIESLVKIKRRLRSDFISDIQNLKFMETNKNNSEVNENQDDNDVIIIDSFPSEASIPLASTTHSTEKKEKDPVRTFGLLKVKFPSELLISSTISIHDKSSDTIVIESEPIAISNDATLPNTQPNIGVVKIVDQSTSLTEKSFKTLVDENLINVKSDIPKDLLKRMATVKVVLDKNLGADVLKNRSYHMYTPFRITTADESDCSKKVLNGDEEKILEGDHINAL